MQKVFCRTRCLGILIIVFAILFTSAVTYFIGLPLIRFASEPEVFRSWVDSHGIWGKLAYMAMVFLQVVVAVIPGEAFEIAAGYAFGAVWGVLLCISAATLGSITVFFLVRRFGLKLTDLFFSRDRIRSLRFLKSSAGRDLLFFLIFMIPGTPKDLLCYFAGLTDIRFSVWLVICSFGRIPSVITSVIGGNALGSKRYFLAILVFLVTALISLSGLMLYRQIIKRKSRQK